MKDSLKVDIDAVPGNIRKIRDFRNYTQDYLAAKLGVSQNAYSKIELGYSKITLIRILQIAEILEVNINDILFFEREKFLRKSG